MAQSDCESEGDDCPSCIADFAIYNPLYENDGVWEEEVVALTTLFQTYNYTYKIIDHHDLNDGALGVGAEQRYRALIAPGGYAYFRDLAVNEAGEAEIRAYIEGGGGYVGFCAGSFWAGESVVWAEEATGGGGTYNQPSDYTAYPYDLGILPGSAVGPLGWRPWSEGYSANLEPARINTSNATMAALGMPAQTHFFYYGGPVFRFDAEPDNLEIWATAMAPSGVPAEATTGDGEASIIRYDLGQGTVVLFSQHPEVLIGSDVDGLTLSFPLAEADVVVDTGGESLAQINYNSWNIVNAALSIVTGRPVAPISPFPTK